MLKKLHPTSTIKKFTDAKYLSLIITISLFIILCLFGSIKFENFFSTQVFLNLIIDNAHLIIIAVGMTFVLLIGGIDLSVGSVVAFTCMMSAYLVEKSKLDPIIVIFTVLLIGAFFGFIQGCFIHHFNMQPFIVTLAGMFLLRGLTYIISSESIEITNKFYVDFSNYKIPILDGFISLNVVISVIVLAIGMYMAHYTKLGRSVYAIGGNEQSAKLMGIKMARTKVMVYTISGFCAALAGVVFSFYMKSGDPKHAVGMELDAIASVVIGGTLLTGGSGYVFGSLFGVMIQGVILTLITFQGTLSTWWTKIIIGILLFLFIALQRVLSSKFRKDTPTS